MHARIGGFGFRSKFWKMWCRFFCGSGVMWFRSVREFHAFLLGLERSFPVGEVQERFRGFGFVREFR